MAHAFGAAIAGAVALLLVTASQFRSHPVPLPVLLAAGAAVALAGGLAADLMARPARIRLDGGWLAISRLGRARRVHTGHLVGLSPNPHAAGSIVLVDEAGNQAEIDVRCLVRNPLIWQRVSRAWATPAAAERSNSPSRTRCSGRASPARWPRQTQRALTCSTSPPPPDVPGDRGGRHTGATAGSSRAAPVWLTGRHCGPAMPSRGR